MMDKVQKHDSFNTNTPLSESYRNYLIHVIDLFMLLSIPVSHICLFASTIELHIRHNDVAIKIALLP
jgi:hypothetical protein